MIESFQKDCLPPMKGMENNAFDLGIPDPPYFSGPEKRKYYGNETGISKHSKTNKKATVKRTNYPVTEKWSVPDDEYFNELFRITKNQIIWGGNYYEQLGEPFKTPRRDEIDEFIKKHPIGWIIWDKCNEKSSFNDFELAWTSFKIPTRIFKFMWNGMMQGKSIKDGDVQQGDKKKNETRIHPTQKPVMLYKWLLNEYAKPGHKIFDSHHGSGSLSIACHDLGFDLVAFEKEKIHYDNYKKRFNWHVRQIRIEGF